MKKFFLLSCALHCLAIFVPLSLRSDRFELMTQVGQRAVHSSSLAVQLQKNATQQNQTKRETPTKNKTAQTKPQKEPNQVTTTSSSQQQFKQRAIRGEEIKDSYSLELKRYINERKYFPKQARRLRHHGKVEVSFVIKKDGTFTLIEISRPSSYKSLNIAALNLVKQLGRFKPLPATVEGDLKLNVSLHYVL